MLTVIVPVYNEASSLPATLPPLIAYVRARGWRLIVVDDCSLDATPEILRTHAADDLVTLVRHKVRRGYGGAIKSGVTCAAVRLGDAGVADQPVS